MVPNTHPARTSLAGTCLSQVNKTRVKVSDWPPAGGASQEMNKAASRGRPATPSAYCMPGPPPSPSWWGTSHCILTQAGGFMCHPDQATGRPHGHQTSLPGVRAGLCSPWSSSARATSPPNPLGSTCLASNTGSPCILAPRGAPGWTRGSQDEATAPDTTHTPAPPRWAMYQSPGPEHLTSLPCSPPAGSCPGQGCHEDQTQLNASDAREQLRNTSGVESSRELASTDSVLGRAPCPLLAREAKGGSPPRVQTSASGTGGLVQQAGRPPHPEPRDTAGDEGGPSGMPGWSRRAPVCWSPGRCTAHASGSHPLPPRARGRQLAYLHPHTY